MSWPTVYPPTLYQQEDIERAAHTLKAIAHPLRLKILYLLDTRESSVQEIVGYVGSSQSNISQHLAILRDTGIVAARKDANRVYYRLRDARILQVIELVRQTLPES